MTKMEVTLENGQRKVRIKLQSFWNSELPPLTKEFENWLIRFIMFKE